MPSDLFIIPDQPFFRLPFSPGIAVEALGVPLVAAWTATRWGAGRKKEEIDQHRD